MSNLLMPIAFAILLCNAKLCYGTKLSPCGVPVIYNQGLPDFSATLYNCSLVMPSAPNAPSYFVGQPSVNVLYQFVLNDLIQVDDLHQTITFDTKFRLQWNDPRWNVPQLFSVLNPT